MCVPILIPVVMAAMAAGSAAMGASEQAKAKGAATDAQRKNQQEIIKQANMQDADTALTMVDKREEAQRQLSEVNL